MSEVTLTKENFMKEVIESDKPVLVDFWATWCGPCRMLGPVLEQLSEKMEGKVVVGKVNVDEQRELAMQYGISSIPALKIFKGGQVVSERVGAAGLPVLENFVNAVL